MDLVRLDRLTLLQLLEPLASMTNHSDSWFSPSLSAPRLTGNKIIDFKQAYVTYGSAVRRIGIYRGKISPGDADDFVHEVFQRVWEKRLDFRGESTAKAWIIGIAYNVARNAAKRYKPKMDAHLDCDALPFPTRLTPEERAVHGEAEAQLTLAVARLKESEQRLFVTYLSADFSVSETARLCGVDYDKVSRDLIAIRAKIARTLAQLQRENGWRKR